MPFHFDKKPALVAYVTCGDPDLATTREIVLAAIEAGAGIIELGVPFSDPVADGPVIQRASERALKHDTSLIQVLKLAAEIREHSQSVGLVIFSYLNPILRMGMEKFCKVARHAGIDGVLITDLPVEESDEYRREAQAQRPGDNFPGRTDQPQRALTADWRGLHRLCLCNLANRRHRYAPADAGRRERTGQTPAPLHQATDCGRLRNIHP